MDPMNNPTPTPNPEPVNPPAPEPAAPVDPTPAPEAAPAPEPAAPAEPPVAPVEPNPAPVNPVINPGANPEPVNPVFQPGGQGGLAATDPIMQPEAPTPPDPVEEELKAPMKAAEPVPGSIGSAVSGGPTDAAAEAPAGNPFAAAPQGQTPSVSFTDPATQPDATPMGAAKPAGKNKKTTLIVLIAVAAVVVVVLAVILIMSLMPQGGNSNSNQSSEANNTVVDEPDDEEEEDDVVVSGAETLSCTRNMTDQELVGINDAVSGAINISAEFDNGELAAISRVDSVVYSDEDAAATEPVENEVHETKAADLTASSALNYYLPTNTDGGLDLTFDAIRANYESLDFTCEVL